MTERELLDLAITARERAYAPYSHFTVGAALLTGTGQVYLGCNVENASYGATICAERTALCAAVSAGERDFRAIAIAGGRSGDTSRALCAPCGICRQFLVELCPADMSVILGDRERCEVYTLSALLPAAFTDDALH